MNNQHPNSTSQSNKGFTLIELLVVIAIVGVLSALLLSNFVGVRERGADAAKKNDARQLKTALRLYYNDFQHYPAGSNNLIQGCGADGDQACLGTFSAGNSEYMKTLPSTYQYFSDGVEEFLLKIPLSNVSDADIVESQTKCNVDDRSGYYDNANTTENDYFVCED